MRIPEDFARLALEVLTTAVDGDSIMVSVGNEDSIRSGWGLALKVLTGGDEDSIRFRFGLAPEVRASDEDLIRICRYCLYCKCLESTNLKLDWLPAGCSSALRF